MAHWIGVDVDEATRICTKCGERKPMSEFYAHAKYGYRKPCRQCFRAYLIDRKREPAEYVRQFKLSRGCMDCGLKTDRPEVYDLDHRPGEQKVEKLSMLVNMGNLDAVIAECAKCDVVCANCHRIRTEDRKAAGVGFTSAFWDLRRRADEALANRPTPYTEATLFDVA